jgi:hypothetical protein
MVAGMLWASGWLPAQLIPRKIVVRGCFLTTAPKLVSDLGYTSGESMIKLVQLSHRPADLDSRWIRSQTIRPKLNRSALISVAERRPLLNVQARSSEYWLCDDGILTLVNYTTDVNPVFQRVRDLPRIELPIDPGPSKLPIADTLLKAAACCELALPDRIERIEIAPDGEMVLHDKQGFPIHLGKPRDLEQKIGSLPGALDVCEADLPELKYLDASDPGILYQKWKQPLE